MNDAVSVRNIVIVSIFLGMVALVGFGRWARRGNVGRSVSRTEYSWPNIVEDPTAEAEMPGGRVRLWRLGIAVIGWLLGGTLLAVATAAGLYRLLGQPRLPTATALGTAELLELLKIALTVVAGFGGVVALTVAYRKQRIAEAAHELARSQERRERTKFFNERFGAASAQLGDDKFAIRLAGVYSMAGLADDWVEQRQTCVDVLCAYLRSPRRTTDENGPEHDVRRTILSVLRDRLNGAGPWAGLTFDFRGAELVNLDFSRLEFHGTVNFDGASLGGSVTDFHATNFSHATVSFRNARFDSELTTFVDASFQQCFVRFDGAHFAAVTVDFSAAELAFAQVTMVEAKLAGTLMRFDGIQFISGELSFARATLENATLDFANGWLGYVSPSRMTRAKLTLSGLVASDSRISFAGTNFFAYLLALDDARLRRCAIDVSDAGFSQPTLGVIKSESLDLVDTPLDLSKLSGKGGID